MQFCGVQEHTDQVSDDDARQKFWNALIKTLCIIQLLKIIKIDYLYVFITTVVFLRATFSLQNDNH